MISRRAVLATATGVAVLAGAGLYGNQAGKLDDLARTIGIEPRRQPAESDKVLIKQVLGDQSALLLRTRATSQAHTVLDAALAPIIVIAQSHVDQLGGQVAQVVPTPPADARAATTAIIQVHKDAAAERAADALEAVSAEFAQVLASMSASLSQNVNALRTIRDNLR